MAVSDVTTILSTIITTGLEIRRLIDTGYGVSEKLKHFQGYLERLDRDQAFWKAQIVKFGLGSDPDLRKIFGDAVSRLENEKKSLPKKISSRWRSKLKRAVFPFQVEQTIIRVERIFDDVLAELDQRDVVTERLRKRVYSQESDPLLSFEVDDCYIRLDKTSKDVKAALDNDKGPPVVLLHGLSGTGKSSLARDLALEVQDAINQRRSQDAGNSQGSGVVEVFRQFEQVIFLECGPRVDLKKQMEHLRCELDRSSKPESEGSEADIIKKLTEVLTALLRDKPVLIILDDVWKSTIDSSDGQLRQSQFFQKMTGLGGQNVKWLITSQEGDLCLKSNRIFKSIPMERIEPDVARRILARHIGFSEDEIPKGIQDNMDRIIEKVDANPLAMTCLSPAIDPTSFNKEREWEDAIRDLPDLLGTKAETFQGKQYGLSYWGAIEVGFDLLTKRHQNLLVLMALCKGPSVPEEIIQYLSEQSKDTSTHYHNFSRARRDLEGRRLIMTSVSKDEMGKEEKRWRVHDMIKSFIRESFTPKDANTSSETIRGAYHVHI